MHRIGKMIYVSIYTVFSTKLLRVEMEFDEIQNQFLNLGKSFLISQKSPCKSFKVSTFFDFRLQYNMTDR